MPGPKPEEEAGGACLAPGWSASEEEGKAVAKEELVASKEGFLLSVVSRAKAGAGQGCANKASCIGGSASSCGGLESSVSMTATVDCGRAAVLLFMGAAKQLGSFSFSNENIEREPSVAASNRRKALEASCTTWIPVGK